MRLSRARLSRCISPKYQGQRKRSRSIRCHKIGVKVLPTLVIPVVAELRRKQGTPPGSTPSTIRVRGLTLGATSQPLPAPPQRLVPSTRLTRGAELDLLQTCKLGFLIREPISVG